MKNLMRAILAVLSIAFLYYLLLPNPDFPDPPPDSLQSDEPADTEIPQRRAYFTDFTREETIAWYKSQLGWGLRLNYPPEDAQAIIRDQTRSTFLEEIVHPFRESVYINGFEPLDAKDAVIINGRHFRQKITVRFVASEAYVRVIVFIGTVVSATALFVAWKKITGDIIQSWQKKN